MKNYDDFVMGKFVLSASLEFAQGSQLNACIRILKAMAEVCQAKLTTSTHYQDVELVMTPTGGISGHYTPTSPKDSQTGDTTSGKID